MNKKCFFFATFASFRNSISHTCPFLGPLRSLFKEIRHKKTIFSCYHIALPSYRQYVLLSSCHLVGLSLCHTIYPSSFLELNYRRLRGVSNLHKNKKKNEISKTFHGRIKKSFLCQHCKNCKRIAISSRKKEKFIQKSCAIVGKSNSNFHYSKIPMDICFFHASRKPDACPNTTCVFLRFYAIPRNSWHTS